MRSLDRRAVKILREVRLAGGFSRDTGKCWAGKCGICHTGVPGAASPIGDRGETSSDHRDAVRGNATASDPGFGDCSAGLVQFYFRGVHRTIPFGS